MREFEIVDREAFLAKYSFCPAGEVGRLLVELARLE